MSTWPMRTLRGLMCAVAAWMPSSASAGDLDISKLSSNLDLASLSDADLAARSITILRIGNVELTSGRIVASDPLVGPDRPALVRAVTPGEYPVTLYEAFGRVAAASMRFAEGRPVRWELAVIPGQDINSLKGDEFFGYPVDAGLGCYMDADTYALIQEREKQVQAEKSTSDINYYDDVLAPELEANKDDYAMHRPISGKRGNVAIFSSGWGDGFYPVFWGLDAGGRPLVLFTDFGVTENADGRREPGGQ
ncbi:DUF4241 domain-containing protein [Rhizobium sp. P44RR-XXIV]|uniref:DUF4241 domain-containing protein n=1 Tax=Rhizobium sp. P44RR-XXIV TaxID=1921145 RepID=UPI0009862C84|nr:DUF4241 domain-containing protein [Rhizobium sp. P44RR-XXIV]TIX92669.1 DUF4241 domain-containing protein [Rhizobium sp. P44RR-XXIV]